MSQNTLVSARVSPELAERLAALAEFTNRSKSYLAAQAIEEFVNVQEWQVEAIREGMEAAKNGEVVGHEQALAVLSGWGKNVKT